MARTNAIAEGMLQRIELVARLEAAAENLLETLKQFPGESPSAEVAVAEAKLRVSILGRALAMRALEAAPA